MQILSTITLLIFLLEGLLLLQANPFHRQSRSSPLICKKKTQHDHHHHRRGRLMSSSSSYLSPSMTSETLSLSSKAYHHLLSLRGGANKKKKKSSSSSSKKEAVIEEPEEEELEEEEEEDTSLEGGSGGSGEGKMNLITSYLQDFYLKTPPFTRLYLFSTLALTLLCFLFNRNQWPEYFTFSWSDDLIPRVRSYYPQAIEDEMMKTEQVAKDIASGFNVLSKEYRAASWAKLPALWNITMQFQGRYDYIWYIDSDATINPRFFSRSIHDLLHHHTTTTTSGNSHSNTSSSGSSDGKQTEDVTFFFFNNFPWRDDVPCADPLLTAMRMEEKSIIEEQEGHIHRLHQWPSLPKNEEEWYNQHVTSKTMLTLPLGQLMEGRLVRFRKEIFIVFNETKRPFARKMIEEGLSIEEKQLLLTYYQPLPIAFHHHHHHHYGQGSSNGSGSGIGSSSEKRKKEEVIGNGSGRQSYYGHRINEFHYKFEREAVTPTGGSGGGSGSASSHHHHRAIKVSREVEEVRLALSHDSKYKEGEVSVARKIFGTDYYQLHPFIFERLPAFFFYSTGLKICQETTGPCKYNS
eukprot:scaffold3475_cov173-Ochromonas_danica.AAC.6